MPAKNRVKTQKTIDNKIAIVKFKKIKNQKQITL